MLFVKLYRLLSLSLSRQQKDNKFWPRKKATSTCRCRFKWQTTTTTTVLGQHKIATTTCRCRSERQTTTTTTKVLLSCRPLVKTAALNQILQVKYFGERYRASEDWWARGIYWVYSTSLSPRSDCWRDEQNLSIKWPCIVLYTGVGWSETQGKL